MPLGEEAGIDLGFGLVSWQPTRLERSAGAEFPNLGSEQADEAREAMAELVAMREGRVGREQHTGGAKTHVPDGLVPRALVDFVVALGTPAGEVVQVATAAVVRRCGVVAVVERSWALHAKSHLRKLGMVNACAVLDSERFSKEGVCKWACEVCGEEVGVTVRVGGRGPGGVGEEGRVRRGLGG